MNDLFAAIERAMVSIFLNHEADHESTGAAKRTGALEQVKAPKALRHQSSRMYGEGEHIITVQAANNGAHQSRTSVVKTASFGPS